MIAARFLRNRRPVFSLLSGVDTTTPWFGRPVLIPKVTLTTDSNLEDFTKRVDAAQKRTDAILSNPENTIKSTDAIIINTETTLKALRERVDTLSPLNATAAMVLTAAVLFQLQALSIQKFFGQNKIYLAHADQLCRFDSLKKKVQKIEKAESKSPEELEFLECHRRLLRHFGWNELPIKHYRSVRRFLWSESHPKLSKLQHVMHVLSSAKSEVESKYHDAVDIATQIYTDSVRNDESAKK